MLEKLADFILYRPLNIINRPLKRTQFPFLIPLGVAIVVWNWPSTLVLLFSEKTIEQKIVYMEGNTSCLTFSVYPIITAAAYLFFMPLAIWLASKWRLKWNKAIELARVDDEYTILQREFKTTAEMKNNLKIMDGNREINFETKKAEAQRNSPKAKSSSPADN